MTVTGQYFQREQQEFVVVGFALGRILFFFFVNMEEYKLHLPHLTIIFHYNFSFELQNFVLENEIWIWLSRGVDDFIILICP